MSMRGWAVICFILGVGLGVAIQDDVMKADAVRHGFAHYDAQTGIWVWNANVSP